MDYKELLKRSRSQLPKEIADSSRFEIPKVRGHIQGNKTVISNFQQIANVLGREPEHLLKYILKELATPGELKKTALLIGSKVSATRVNEKIINYFKEFVLCNECTKPDTKLEKTDGVLYLKCMACGSRRAVKAKI